MSITDFTNGGPSVQVILTGATDQVIATLGAGGSSSGASDTVSVQIQVIGGTLTSFKARCTMDISQGFVDYLDDADWVLQTNGAQRFWSSSNPTTLTPLQSCLMTFHAHEISQWQFCAMGGLGTIVRIIAKSTHISTES